MKIKLVLILSLISYLATAQIQIERQVIGSAGGYFVTSNLAVSSTVGETMVQTLRNTSTVLTQGFQQPSFSSIIIVETSNESCVGAQNGTINIISVMGCSGRSTTQLFSINDTTSPLSTNTDLSAGEYLVRVSGFGCSASRRVVVGIDSDVDCMLRFYNGITPNNDGRNDSWVIDNIEVFPENSVAIFNRWGLEVWSVNGYDNTNNVWGGNNNSGGQMADGTYYYVVNVGSKTYRGWVELTR